MHQSKHTVSTNHLKRKEITSVTPFESYNTLTKQRNPQPSSHMTSSRKQTNRSLLEPLEKSSPNSHLCLQHSLCVSSVCFTCNFALICQQCSKQYHALSGQHDIRSLQKSSLFIKNTLIHSQIKLQAKCNILTNINEQLKNHKIELFTEKNDYKQELEKTFEYLHQMLSVKQREMMEDVEDIYQEHDKKYAQTIEEIKSLQGYYDRCQQTISAMLDLNAQQLGEFPICQFYSQRKDLIDQIVRDNELNQFKKHIYEVKYKIQQGQLNSIVKALNHSQVGCDLKFTYFDPEEVTQSRQSSLKKAIFKVKSEHQLKNKPSKKKLRKPIRYLDLEKTEKPSLPQSRLEKQRQSHKINGTFCTSTPKQGLSHQKKFQFLKKSPEPSPFLLKKRKKSCAKMISMPSSPAKQDKEDRFSPSNKAKELIIDGMKKKTTITKKKK